MKICFVIDKYLPNIGGGTHYVQQLAEECVSRGIEVTVVTESQRGRINGVNVECDPSFLDNNDLVVVHGYGPSPQRHVISNYKKIKSKILLLPIEPSDSKKLLEAAQNVYAVGCSTLEDWEWAKSAGLHQKAHHIPHGINKKTNIGTRGIFKKGLGIGEDTKMFLSCGGYWENKRMKELVSAFLIANVPDAVLVTTGYCRFDNIPKNSKNVINIHIGNTEDVKDAMADADCYIMNSSSEGFGMVILEAMINRVPWIGENIAGARLLSDFGTTYSSQERLVEILREGVDSSKVDSAYLHVVNNHLVSHTVDRILSLIDDKEAKTDA